MNKDPYIVSDETCKGCMYYKYTYLDGNEQKDRYCDYTLATGKIKPHDMKCADCTFRVDGSTRRRWKKRVVW